MRLTINGESRDSMAKDLASLWREETAELDVPGPQGFAIALNGEVVRRAEWSRTPLSNGDQVEIIRAFSGG